LRIETEKLAAEAAADRIVAELRARGVLGLHA
jgi:hypothetical protein